MSYILDALKKSEQDRGNGSIPNVQTIHSSALNYHQEKRALWPWILIAVLIANVFILIYFLKPEVQPQEITPVRNAETFKQEITPQSIKVSNTIAVQHPVITEAPVTEPAISEPQTPEQNDIEPATIQVEKQLLPIDELPVDIQQQIPEMIFSAHVYSSEPMQRSMVINNRFMEEGDVVSYDLVLVEITRNGAIFDFRGQLFSASVLSGWGN